MLRYQHGAGGGPQGLPSPLAQGLVSVLPWAQIFKESPLHLFCKEQAFSDFVAQKPFRNFKGKPSL